MYKVLTYKTHVSHWGRNFLAKARLLKGQTITALEDTSGQQLTEHAGWIVVIVLIILAAVAYCIPQIRTVLLPALFTKVLNMINTTG